MKGARCREGAAVTEAHQGEAVWGCSSHPDSCGLWAHLPLWAEDPLPPGAEGTRPRGAEGTPPSMQRGPATGAEENTTQGRGDPATRERGTRPPGEEGTPPPGEEATPLPGEEGTWPPGAEEILPSGEEEILASGAEGTPPPGAEATPPSMQRGPCHLGLPHMWMAPTEPTCASPVVDFFLASVWQVKASHSAKGGRGFGGLWAALYLSPKQAPWMRQLKRDVSPRGLRVDVQGGVLVCSMPSGPLQPAACSLWLRLAEPVLGSLLTRAGITSGPRLP